MNVDLSGCLEEMERRALLPDDRLAVICVGSVARGWANDSSDFDFHVITREYWQGTDAGALSVSLTPDSVPAVGVHVDDRRWEIKYWMDTHYDQMIAKVGWDRYEEGVASPKIFGATEELALERILSCLVLSGEEWVRRRREEIEASAFKAFATTRSLADADGSLEDALGQLAAGDTESAVLSARRALGHIVDALLESHGVYGYWQPKWRARRFRDASPKQLSFEEYWSLETMRDFDPAAPEGWVTQVVRLCHRLFPEIEV
jgi:hypothetical protein